MRRAIIVVLGATFACGLALSGCSDDQEIAGKRVAGEICTTDNQCGDDARCHNEVCRLLCYSSDNCNRATDHCEDGFCLPGAAMACGDGILDTGEACDDKNLVADDGCSVTCVIEPGWSCTASAPSACERLCGNGALDTGELCDDGNADGEDGCNSQCVSEPGWACDSQAPTACVSQCGDGVIVGSEQCDVGPAGPSDGCTACSITAGWICLGEPSVCHRRCSDGVVDANEACDDGNATAGDGCDGNCEIEAGWDCTRAAPSSCSCADGYQDNDINKTCLPTCETAGLTGCNGRGTCSDATGVAVCSCDDYYAGPQCGDCVVRVDQLADPPGDGASWSTAYPAIESAIGQCNTLMMQDPQTTRCEIWVTRGTYAAMLTTGVSLIPDVALYGGFGGYEVERDARRPGGTVLTNSASASNTNVLLLADNTLVDGFSIQFIPSAYDSTGAVVCDGCDGARLVNCTISGLSGGTKVGVRVLNGGRLAIERTSFTNNASNGVSCLMADGASTVAVTNSFFANNGGASSVSVITAAGEASLLLAGCTLVNNMGYNILAALGNATLEVVGSIVWNNAVVSGGTTYALAATAAMPISYSFLDVSPPAVGSGNILGTDPLLGASFDPMLGSPCLDKGVERPDLRTDITGATRVCLGEGGIVKEGCPDMGAYEFVP